MEKVAKEIFYEIKRKLKCLDRNRLIHTYGVLWAALNLAEKYKQNLNEVFLVAVLHDLLREEARKKGDILKHGEYAARWFNNLVNKKGVVEKVLKSWGIKVDEVCEAVSCHVLGEGCNFIGKILFIADYSEPMRKHKEAYIVWRIALKNIDEAFLKSKVLKRVYFESRSRLQRLNGE